VVHADFQNGKTTTEVCGICQVSWEPRTGTLQLLQRGCDFSHVVWENVSKVDVDRHDDSQGRIVWIISGVKRVEGRVVELVARLAPTSSVPELALTPRQVRIYVRRRRRRT